MQVYGGGYPQMGGYQGGYDQPPGMGGYEQHRVGGMRPEDQWAAQQKMPQSGPNNWCLYRTPDSGEVYYHNHATGVTQWDRPAEWPLN